MLLQLINLSVQSREARKNFKTPLNWAFLFIIYLHLQKKNNFRPLILYGQKA